MSRMSSFHHLKRTASAKDDYTRRRIWFCVSCVRENAAGCWLGGCRSGRARGTGVATSFRRPPTRHIDSSGRQKCTSPGSPPLEGQSEPGSRAWLWLAPGWLSQEKSREPGCAAGGKAPHPLVDSKALLPYPARSPLKSTSEHRWEGDRKPTNPATSVNHNVLPANALPKRCIKCPLPRAKRR